jgi:hypothetical protein
MHLNLCLWGLILIPETNRILYCNLYMKIYSYRVPMVVYNKKSHQPATCKRIVGHFSVIMSNTSVFLIMIHIFHSCNLQSAVAHTRALSMKVLFYILYNHRISLNHNCILISEDLSTQLQQVKRIHNK